MKSKKAQKAKVGGLDKNQQLIQNIGKRIKALRQQNGFTAGELFAFEHNINRSQYIGYERGVDMRISSLAKICEANGITLREFFSKGFEE